MPSINFNFNTILMGIVLAVLMWVGATVQATSVQIAVIAEKTNVQDRELLSLRARVSQIEFQISEFKGSSLPFSPHH